MKWPSLAWFQRWRLRALGFITVIAAAVVSFDSVRHLAENNGFGWQSWLFPLTIDAVAAVGMDLWMRRSPAWRAAASLALCAIVVSLCANVADHAVRGGPGAGMLGAVPPAALAALLWVFHRHNRNAERASVKRESVRLTPSAEPERGAGRVPARDTDMAPELAPARESVSDEEAILIIRGEEIATQRGVRARFGMGATRAARLYAAAYTYDQENAS